MLPSQTMSQGSKLVARYSEMNYSNGRTSRSYLPNFVPSNICNSIPIDMYGSGACGYNSYCMFDGQRPKCQCPDGYTFIDPEDVMRGCKQNFLSQSCDEALPELDLFYLKSMPNTDWLGKTDYESFPEQNEDWCRIACLGDCFCAATFYENRICWKKKAPLPNGRIDSSFKGKALIKIRKDNSTLKPLGADMKKKDQSTVILIVSVLLSSSVFLNLLFLLAVFLLVFCFKYWKPKAHKLYPFMPGMNLRSYTYEELTEATNGFREELGRGAFAKVYNGVLESEDRKLVTVKRLNDMVRDGDLQFKAEVSAFGRTNHRNLVQLLGFCNEGQHRLLVYEFMSNGSIASILFGGSRPNWHQRIQIALETTKGLFYLHEECSTQIIHCDIKPQNILLDDTFTARISDFGLAKLLKTDQTRTTTGIRGTKGYVAPEWFRHMPVTAKAYDCFKERKLDLLGENDEEAIDNVKRVENYVMIAIWCIQEDPSLRPTMKKVVQMMEGAVEVSFLPAYSTNWLESKKQTHQMVNLRKGPKANSLDASLCLHVFGQSEWGSSQRRNNMALQVSYLLSLLLLILLLPYSTTAQTSSNQSLGSSLTAQEKDSYWASPSGDFAFDFSQFGKGGYLLAIWFNKLPEKTIVWSANGDNLVSGGSKVELTKDGKFVLNDPAGLEIWKVNLVSSGVAYAAMLDTGNFTMSQGSKLVARYSEMNYSNGRFQFQLRLNGSLVLQTRAYPTDYSYADYWPEEPIGSGFKDFYQRAIMEYDGVLRHYVYPKSSLMSRSWSSLPTFIPSNICNFVPLNMYGYGILGITATACSMVKDQNANAQLDTPSLIQRML
uniref:non-specific serine/threonine protein kinase n=1 Tax=Quercus lobata TaxID=97700 RepID=A0A7N2QX34_QUELO